MHTPNPAFHTQQQWDLTKMARDNTENNFITIVPETASQVAKQSSSVPLLLLLSSLAPLANKLSCFVSMCVSSDKFILSEESAKSPLLGPRRGFFFLQQL